MIGMLRQFELRHAKALGRCGDTPPVVRFDGWQGYPSLAVLLTLAAMIAPAASLASPAMTAAICAALLIGGLPHGALDLALLRRDAEHRTALAVGLYLGLGALMFATWQVAPALALALFLAMAMAHFAEDWPDAEHPFFALGIAVALLSAPTLLHHHAVGDLFAVLTGEPASAGLADALLLIAPAASACALLSIVLLWKGGHGTAAVNASCALAAMILLPPITGFAIYFCLIHSPTHFRAGLKRLAPETGVLRLTVVATLGGLAIALAILQFLPIGDPSSRLFAASFMTLSILTLPHMAVPLLLRRLPSGKGLPPR